MCFEFDVNDTPTIKSNDSKFVRVLKTLMWVKQLNQRQLADVLCIRQNQISNLLRGKSLPSYYVLQQLKNRFEWDIAHYFE